MIQASELRIGNYLNFTFMGLTEVYSVFEFTHNNVKITEDTQYQISMVSGIPLTEELLLKMGFAAIGTSGNTEYFSLDEWDIDFYEGEWHVNLAAQSITSIKYVHQLMNIYHALTGQELTLS